MINGALQELRRISLASCLLPWSIGFLLAQERVPDILYGEQFLEAFNISDEDVKELGCFDTLSSYVDLSEAIIDTTILQSDTVAWSILSLDVNDSVGNVTMNEVYFLMSHTWPRVRPIELLELYQTNVDRDLEYEYEVIRPDFLECRWGREEDSDEEESTWLMVGNRSIFIRPNGEFTDQFGDPLKR